MPDPRFPHPPPPPPPRSAWRALVGSSALALRAAAIAATPGPNLILPPEPGVNELACSFDSSLAAALAHNDARAFEFILAKALAERDNPSRPLSLPHALRAAVEPGLGYYLRRLLEAGANPNEILAPKKPSNELPRSHPLLNLAASQDASEAIETLVAAGANPAAIDAFGQTALIVAARLCKPRAALALIRSGCPVGAVDTFNEDALGASLRYFPSDDPLCPHASLSSKLKVKPMLERLERGALIALALLTAGAPPRPDRPASSIVNYPLPPLAAAIRIQNAPLIDALIQAGADARWLLPAEEQARCPGDFGGASHIGGAMAHWVVAMRKDPGLADMVDIAQRVARSHYAFLRMTPAASLGPSAASSAPAPESLTTDSPEPPEPPISPPPRPILASQRAANALRSELSPARKPG